MQRCPGWDPEKGECSFAVPRTFDKDLRGFCRDILVQLRRRYGLLLASLRSVDPVHRKLIYLASDGAQITDLKKPVLDWSKSGNLSGIAAESRKVVCIEDIRQSHDGRMYAHPRLMASLGLKRLVSIPILNSCNMNQVLLILNLYPSARCQGLDEEEAEQLGDVLAVRFEEFLKDRCMHITNRLGIEMTKLKKTSAEHIYAAVAIVLSQAVGANSTGIYIERADRRGVELKSSIGKDFDAKHSSDIDELAHSCWMSNREFLTISPVEAPVRHGELLPPPIPDVLENTPSSAFVPLRDLAGRAKGVLCCLKGKGEGPLFPVTSEGLFPFTYEDIALIEAVSQAFAPQLQILMADICRTDSLNKLAHEMRVPVVATRAALERVQKECVNHKYEFQYDHLKDLSTYCDVMNRLLQRLDAVRKDLHEIPLAVEKVHIFSEIIPPAIRFVRPLLEKQGLNHKSITYIGLNEIPELHLDVGLMTTVVFNLLDNAIKYARHDPKDFRIEVEGRTIDSSFEIIFRDWGIGVPEGWETEIFESGRRGPNAYEYDVAGQGLGLWFAREIIGRHQGQLELRHLKDPTTFVISLPKALKKEGPANASEER